MKVEVTMPEEYMGDVIGSLNSKRGQIEGMEISVVERLLKHSFHCQKCSVTQQNFVQLLRDVVTIQCSLKSTRQLQSLFRIRLHLQEQNNIWI